MKIRPVFGLLLAVITLFSCKKDNELGPGFDMVYRRDFSIFPGLNVFTVHHFQLENIASNYQQYLTESNRTDADIARIVPTQVNLSGVFGDDNFNFVEEVKVHMFLESDPTDFVEFAYRFPVPLEPGNNIGFITNEQNLHRFLSQNRYSVDVIFRIRSSTPNEISARLDMQFKAIYK